MMTSIIHSRPPERAPAAGGNDMGESFANLFLRLPRVTNNGCPPPRTLGLTSCSSGEGVSTVAVRLAAEAAVTGREPVLLVDANLARPALHKLLRVKAGPGLAEALRDGTPLPEIIQPAPVERLFVLAAGRVDGLASVQDSPGLSGLLETLKEEFGLIVLDLPPTASDSLAARLASLLDGVVLVVEAERTLLDKVQQEKERLEGRIRLLGVVLNKGRQYTPKWLDRML